MPVLKLFHSQNTPLKKSNRFLGRGTIQDVHTCQKDVKETPKQVLQRAK